MRKGKSYLKSFTKNILKNRKLMRNYIREEEFNSHKGLIK